MVEEIRRELDRYSRTKRWRKHLSVQFINLRAYDSRFLIEQNHELEHLVRLWRDVAYSRRPGRQIATRCLTFLFGVLSDGIYALLSADKSEIMQEELHELEKVSPEIVVALPAAAKLVAEEGLAFLETQSQSTRRISRIRFRWLDVLRHLEDFADDPRVGEARGRIVRELKERLANPRLPRTAVFKLLGTLAELAPEFEPEPSRIAFLQGVVDNPGNSSDLEWALSLQVCFGLENPDDAESILSSWHSTLRDGVEFDSNSMLFRDRFDFESE